MSNRDIPGMFHMDLRITSRSCGQQTMHADVIRQVLKQ